MGVNMTEQELKNYREKLVLKPEEEWRRDTFIPFKDRKKIILLSDDLRLPSGVGCVSKEIIMKNSFNIRDNHSCITRSCHK